MNDIQTTLGYSIFFNEPISQLDSFIKNNDYSKVAILGDSNTLEKCLTYVNLFSETTPHFDLIEIDPGEENKNIDICIGIWSMMQDFNLDRKSLLINLGGGVVSDMGSFAASTYMRGIDFIHIPTTLLAMVDACVGGKTGIDLMNYKNHIGTFSHPKAVFVIPELLSSLEERELRSGFAEMIKHGVITEGTHLIDCLSHLENGLPELPELIRQSIKIKRNIVEKDPEEKGIRKSLNFGHTIGHGIESYFLSMERPILHGEAIAFGMVTECYLSKQYCALPVEEFDYIISNIKSLLNVPVINMEMEEDIISFIKKDKKNKGGDLRFSLISKIGKPELDISCSEENVIKALKDSINYFNAK